MSGFLVGNPRCKRCGEHHPELWDCSVAFVHAFEPEHPEPPSPAEQILIDLVMEQHRIDNDPAPIKYRAPYGALTRAIEYLKARNLYPSPPEAKEQP